METDGYERDPRNHTIFTCQFIVTTMIISVGLLGLHSEKSATVHNCRRWRGYMNMDKLCNCLWR